ncbi:pentatricopeptide repeat-containing protein At5g67570, chloroplastic isoform X1 [Punica granatum]|uniref:Pentatricopeptide repeat-containing protein At5g67570, chloroplastic isoform X1 n=1 Tax=Punica granatum TaxID=22663 RepID=A0A218VYW0_PUNGR|nr:pentatricopeptide repeat-containing protein At5g67570, chloroplastic isoform X1 [Punica granatum]OWM65685.1 hypothetical protein CDL15_Pgr017182 [Punica granatum]
MEASPSNSHQLPPAPKFQPNTERIKRRLLKNGVFPTPKIVHTLRKKAIQKHDRKQDKNSAQSQDVFPPAQQQALLEEAHCEKLKREYKEFNKAVNLMVGLPWEGVERVTLRELASARDEYEVGVVRRTRLRELGEMFEGRKREELQWVLEDDPVEWKGSWVEREGSDWDPQKSRKRRTESEVVKFLVTRLSASEIDKRDWKFSRMMKQSGLQFTEEQLLKILEGLGSEGRWKQAMSVVEWVYDDKQHRHWKSRFVYTKLLAVLGKARRPQEALKVFNQMLEDFHIYPDMAAYHSIAVTLGQSGLVKELLNLIESMREKTRKKIKNLRKKSWDPVLEPDLIVYNAVLNACVPSHQWKGVSWVFEQLRMSGLKPNGATYGLAMEVMLQSGKYDLVHEFFRKMKRSGEAPRAITYKVLVTSFWREGKVDEAVEAVRDMERRGVVGTASVYYELACCLCNNGRWQEAVVEVEKSRKLPHAKPLEVTFTGLIISSMEGGHIDDCISLFNYMKGQCDCSANIGTINTMLRIYGRNDMFSEAKELFEEIKGTQLPERTSSGSDNVVHVSLIPDEYTYSLMLEASARALQWEYFEYVYKEMTLSHYRLDQTKHASFLMAASKAGKGHLLEHAFDSILEAGEVPQPLVFLEMVFQATAQHNYERAVTLITIMAHAPFQVTEKQWTELFGRSNRRIPEECWENLLGALRNCPLANEATVTNLARSLNSLLERSVESGEISSLGKGTGNSQADLVGRRSLSFGQDDLGTVNHGTSDGGEPKIDMRGEKCYIAGEVCGDDLPEGESNGIDSILSTFRLDDDLEDEDEEDNDDLELGLEYDSDEDEEIEPDLPSAEEILQMWKESRQKDDSTPN